MRKLRKLAVAAGACVGVMALTGSALADTTVSVTLGPVPVPNVPVEVCVTHTDIADPIDECVTAPAGESLSLTVVVHVETPEGAGVPPAVTPIPCPVGTSGIAAQVFTGSGQVSIAGSVTVVLNDGTPVTVPIREVLASGGQTLTVFACAGISPGIAVPLPGL